MLHCRIMPVNVDVDVDVDADVDVDVVVVVVDDDDDDDVEEEEQSQDREAHLVQACAVEMHMDVSQEPFCMEIYKGKCHTPWIHLDTISIEHWALTVTVRIPQCGHSLGYKQTKRKQEQTAFPSVRLRCPVTTAIMNGIATRGKGVQKAHQPICLIPSGYLT